MSDNTVIPVWIDGQPADRLPVSDRGLAYGDGLFETILITSRGPVLPDYHLDRLELGLQRLGLRLSRQQVHQTLHAYPGFRQPGIVKLIVTAGSGGRGYFRGDAAPVSILSHHPAPAYPAAFYEQGIRVFPCKTRLCHQPLLAGLKHLNRLEQVLARNEWGNADDFQEGLVCDMDGHPVEGTLCNRFIVEGDEVVTPSLDNCGVAGVMRRWLLEQLPAQGLRVKETPITLERFRLAGERFFCNSVLGVWPVAHFEQDHWPAGPVTRLAQQLIWSHFH